jgi:hypothetical protein
MTEHERKVIQLETLLYMTEQAAALEIMLILAQWKIARFKAVTGVDNA